MCFNLLTIAIPGSLGCVPAVHWCLSSLLTIQYISSALQDVSGWYALMYFKPADYAYSCSLGCVTAMLKGASTLLTLPVLGCLECEWLPVLGVFWAHWLCLSLVLQLVSGFCALLFFKPADNACPWLSRMWVAVSPCFVSSLHTIFVFGSSGGEWLLCMP